MRVCCLSDSLSPGACLSVQGLALEEGQAGEFVTSLESSSALDNGQSQCMPASKLLTK